MTESKDQRVPWPLWPFYALWKLVTFILTVTGRILCALLGVALMIAGLSLSMTIIGAVAGLPLAVFGLLLVVRALF